MKKSKVCILTGITAGALLLTGCRETPDSVIVKQKGEKAIEKYEEEKTDTSSDEASRNIREKLSVPETFSEDITAEDGKIIIHTDAAVELPDTTGFSTVEVKAVPLTQEFMDTITNGLFPEKKMYEPEYYYGMTKEYYQNKINEVRALMAQDSAESESGEALTQEDLQQMLEEYEAAYAVAPKSLEKKETAPLLTENGTGDPRFSGVAEDENGRPYSYFVKASADEPVSVQVKYLGDTENASDQALWSDYTPASQYVPEELGTEEKIKSAVGISYEEAKKTADEKAASIGISDMSADAWDYAICRDIERSDEVIKTGFVFYYTRKIDGCPVTYTSAIGGGLEDMDSTIEPWTYEHLSIVISKEGLEELSYGSPYELGEVQVENVKLLDFEEIAQIYSQMMQYKLSGELEGGYIKSCKVNVNRVTLGYSRIYSPTQDNRSGVLVPVWDFFGNYERTLNEGEGPADTDTERYNSLLTINAVDGTVIDRGLGY